jgi:hypothetical protein
MAVNPLDSFEMSLITEYNARIGTTQCLGNKDISPEKTISNHAC